MKIAFIVPYYGKFPSYFNLFLKSCQNNPDYDWFIFSDIKGNYDFPNNVHYVELSFEELKNKIQDKMGFSISLNSPYKLCDFKPVYGYVFYEYIENYDYWGYCDVDLLFGDLHRFIPHEEIKKYDKIGHLGHMTLYRNDTEINRLFACKIDGTCRYKEVFQTDNICIFDEWNRVSINHIFLENKKKVWMFNEFFDVYPYDDNMRRVIRKIPERSNSYGEDIIEKKISFASIEDKRAFQWVRGRGNWIKIEVAYIHFQKRDMQVLVDESVNKFFCMSNQFISMDGESIPRQYMMRAKWHQIFNKRKFSWEGKKILYWIIEKSSPFRHLFRSR